MSKRSILITGSSGLVGSEAVLFFDARGYEVVGVDNNMRADFFGPQADTTANLKFLQEQTSSYTHVNLDIRDRAAVMRLFNGNKFSAIIHCAAQPSHDLASQRPFDDFDVNAGGTLNLLEATRTYFPESPFVLTSTNKVYGDAPNELALVEHAKRFEYANAGDYFGISESCRIDQCLHSLFGVSKAAGDLMTQEYGRYFGMSTACFRAGCITGARHQGVELHGFLNYLARVFISGKPYKVIGHKGKQVRDQIHARDLVQAMSCFIDSPRVGEVYNIGGGRECNISLLEAVALLEDRFDKKIVTEYVPQSRIGDHICYISDTRKFKKHYPKWAPEYDMKTIVEELYADLIK